MKVLKYLFLIIILNNLLTADGSELILTPSISYNYLSNGSIYHTEAIGNSSLTQIKLSGEQKNKDWRIQGYFQFTSLKNVDLSLAQNNQDLFIEKRRGYYTSDDNWFEYSYLDIQYKKSDTFTLFTGKKAIHWGFGNSSLILSKDVPSYPLAGFVWKMSNAISLEFFNAILSSQIEDTTNTLYENINRRKVFFKKSVAGHKLTWRINPSLTFHAMETVIFGHRTIDPHYLLPFIPFWSMQHYIGDIDNVQMCGELIWHPSIDLQIYSSLFVDEWRPEWTFENNNRNWFGYQIGLNKTRLLRPSDSIQLEYTWTDHRVYRHKYDINSSYTYDYPLGFWLGPHAEEFYFNYQINFKKISLKLNASITKRGELSNEILEGQYKDIQYSRYSNQFESRSVTSLQINKSFLNGLGLITGMIENIHWENAGFNPYEISNSPLQNIDKISVNIGVSVFTEFVFK